MRSGRGAGGTPAGRPRVTPIRRRRIRFSTALAAAIAASFALAGWPGPPPSARGETQDLAAAAARAADAIRRHQDPKGYWTTPVTPGPVYESPHTEINVFTPAVIIDLLDPVARETGLGAELARGRDYLRRQIEGTGLVRYHGDPGPIAADGCALPPDADDTALVWRIAPLADTRRLAAARREIERYRATDGLYRTWLADEDASRCFYVRFAGREWNPPDVAVEMHVYLFLADHDAGAAGRLCEALGRHMDDDRIWVWYAVAPMLPVLREVDLARKGCAIRVPPSRVARAVAGQEQYLTQSRLLASLVGAKKAKDGARAPRTGSPGSCGPRPSCITTISPPPRRTFTGPRISATRCGSGSTSKRPDASPASSRCRRPPLADGARTRRLTVPTSRSGRGSAGPFPAHARAAAPQQRR